VEEALAEMQQAAEEELAVYVLLYLLQAEALAQSLH
jgi:hypothetical protein